VTIQVRVVVIEQEPLFRSCLRALIDQEPGMRVVGEAASGHEALPLLDDQRVDAIVMEVGTGEVGGLKFAQKMARRHPRLRVIILSKCVDPLCVQEVMDSDFHGYVSTQSTGDVLREAIRTVCQGEAFVDPSVALDVSLRGAGKSPTPVQDDRLDRLTVREQEVCRLLAYGYTNVEVGEKLEISNRTVETHRTKIMSKLGLSRRCE